MIYANVLLLKNKIIYWDVCEHPNFNSLEYMDKLQDISEMKCKDIFNLLKNCRAICKSFKSSEIKEVFNWLSQWSMSQEYSFCLEPDI